MNEEQGPIPGYCVVDILGHVRVAGYVSEAVVAGATLLRVAIPTAENEWQAIYYSPASLYAIRPCTEELARRLAEKHPLPAFDLWDLSGELREKIRNVERLEREGQLPPQYPERRRRNWDPDWQDEDEDTDPNDMPFE